ncbi:MAG: GNAT family N-acetyltransferase [Anaerolineae bacterium]
MVADSDPNRAGEEPRTLHPRLSFRIATPDDAPLLARLNRELIEDEGHRNPMALPELEERMRGWVAGEYQAVLFEREDRVVAYALFRSDGPDIHLRHLFAVRDARRQGIATEVLRTLARGVWPSNARISLDVLVGNAGAIAFYEALGFRPYALTLEIEGERLVRSDDVTQQRSSS